jgi:hypothetical protein
MRPPSAPQGRFAEQTRRDVDDASRRILPLEFLAVCSGPGSWRLIDTGTRRVQGIAGRVGYPANVFSLFAPEYWPCPTGRHIIAFNGNHADISLEISGASKGEVNRL